MDQKFPYFTTIAVVIALIGIGFMAYRHLNSVPEIETVEVNVTTPTPVAMPTIKATPTPIPTMAESPSTPVPIPVITPPPLNNSDEYISQNFDTFPESTQLASLLTNEHIIRKFVRAVYGLSEGRIVQQHRPLASPRSQFATAKIGQQTDETKQELYRIARENHTRYTPYVTLFSALNNDATFKLYKFYQPTLEEAYQELGVGKGDFHSTFIKAVDVLLQTPEVDSALLLTRPSVAYEFTDPKLEKLPPAHKLMLRMGQENREAMRLELKKLKQRLNAT